MRVFTNFQKVEEFHKAFGLPIAVTPTQISRERENLRNGFIVEEFCELLEAQGYCDWAVSVIQDAWEQIKTDRKDREPDLVGIADALTDLKYFIEGSGLEYGIDMDQCFEEVHASNMSKLGEDGKPIYREDGKVLKGPAYFKPDLKSILGWT